MSRALSAVRAAQAARPESQRLHHDEGQWHDLHRDRSCGSRDTLESRGSARTRKAPRAHLRELAADNMPAHPRPVTVPPHSVTRSAELQPRPSYCQGR
eukprot:705543-Rhodomonas_salina.3